MCERVRECVKVVMSLMSLLLCACAHPSDETAWQMSCMGESCSVSWMQPSYPGNPLSSPPILLGVTCIFKFNVLVAKQLPINRHTHEAER